MFGKSLKKVVSLVKKNRNGLLVVLVVVVVVVGVVVYRNNSTEESEDNTLTSLEDIIGKEDTEQEELTKVLNEVVEKNNSENVAVNVSEKQNNEVQENFNIADCLAAGGDYETCK